MAFIVVSLSGVALSDSRPAALSEERQPDGSVVSRESSFLFNNLVLLVSCFAVFWGTMFPVSRSRIARQDHGRCSLFQPGQCADCDFPALFDRSRAVAGMAESIDQQSEAEFPDAGDYRPACGRESYSVWRASSTSMPGFAGHVDFRRLTIIREFYKGARARGARNRGKLREAIVNLTLRNTRRYGGYIVHFGFVLLFVGWSGQAFS